MALNKCGEDHEAEGQKTWICQWNWTIWKNSKAIPPHSLYIYIYRENLNLFSDLKVIRVLKVRVLVQVSETKEQTLA